MYTPPTDRMNTATDKMEDQYNTPCENCTIVLSENVHIMCCTNGEEEMTLCAQCWYEFENEWREDGWKCDEDDGEEEVCYKCKDTLCEIVGVVFPKKDNVCETFCDPCWFNNKAQWKNEGWVNEDEDEDTTEQ